MIAVIANPADRAVVIEFFELFKTSWEFYRPGQQYDVLICTDESELPSTAARLTVNYSNCPQTNTSDMGVSGQAAKRKFLYRGKPIPVYGPSDTFAGTSSSKLVDEVSGRSGLEVTESAGRRQVRVGYALFHEVRRLLTQGQPEQNADIPTLELHIAILRDLITAAGIPLVEIPPVPDGYKFIACLTHDVDHPFIAEHKWDHTTFGFLYRATIGSLVRLLRGRLGIGGLARNWVAALRLPFVHLGLSRDFWADFDRYVEMEREARSSFFVIPFKNDPGRTDRGVAPKRRASRYGAKQFSAKARHLMSAGCEVALHGIDAWRDSLAARAELDEIRRLTGANHVGTRMHWLYFDEQSPQRLDEAGADYDSSNGFNETVGFRAGTTQAYKPLGTKHLLELPLHVMDTALFYPSHLDLSFGAAWKRVTSIVDSTVQNGGCITVNWHDRSIAPERQWGGFYSDLIEDLRGKGAWFSTAAQAVSWFRKRRSAVFYRGSQSGTGEVTVAVDECDELPGLQLRVFDGKDWRQTAVGARFTPEGHIGSGLEAATPTVVFGG